MKLQGKFLNPFASSIRKQLFHFLLWKLGFYADSPDQKLKEKDFLYPLSLPSFDERGPSCVWINHSTFLVEAGGFSFLTDPTFSHRCSPVQMIGPKRHHAPALSIEAIHKVNFVLISHNHYDHLDRDSIIKLYRTHPDIVWIVPLGVKKWFLKRGIEKVVELDWWESFSQDALRIVCVPAQHFSGRYLLDLNDTLWAGFVVEVAGKKFYFSGDTGYNAHDFKKIGEIWNGIDLSLIPIGAYRPKQFMQPVHVDPQEAVRIHQDVKSQFSIGMHWKTFRLAEEPMQRPPYDLYLAMKEAKLDPKSFIAIDPGIYVNW